MRSDGSSYRDQPVAGALFLLGASLVIAAVGAIIKVVAAELPNEMVVFFRNFSAMIFILLWWRCSRPRLQLRTRCFKLHFLRSMAGLGAMYCFFYAVHRLRLGDAFLLLATAPLFIPVIAFLWLGEPVPPRVRIAVALGFAGVALILKPGSGIFQPAAVVGLGSGVLSALAMVSIRRMSVSEPALRIVFYFTLLALIGSTIPLTWAWRNPRPGLYFLFGLMGMLAVLGQFLQTKGYSYAAAAKIGPFAYGQVLFATLVGWLFWGEALDILTWVGALLICGGGVVAVTGARAAVVPVDVGAGGAGEIRTPGIKPDKDAEGSI